MPFNNAVYDAGRDVIFAVRGGYIFRCNATTGAIIECSRFTVPDFDDTYVVYAPNVDKLYATYWHDRQANNDAPVQGYFKINPDTFAVEAFITTTGIDDELASGPFGVEYSAGFVWAIYQNNTAEAFSLQKLDPTSDTVLSTTSVDGPSTRLISQIAVKSSDGSLSMVRRTNVRNYSTVPALNFSTGSLARIGFGLAHDLVNGQYYVVTATQFVEKCAASAAAVFADIDTGVTDATPRRARWNSIDGKVYIPGWKSDSVIVIDPAAADAVTIQTGFDSPYDMVFTPTKKWAVQHGNVGLKEVA